MNVDNEEWFSFPLDTYETEESTPVEVQLPGTSFSLRMWPKMILPKIRFHRVKDEDGGADSRIMGIGIEEVARLGTLKKS